MSRDLHSSYPGRIYFERGASLLKESLESDRVSFSKGISCQTFESLCRVRILPNGRLNLGTVDELVRSCFHILTSNVFNNIDEREK